MKVLVLNGSPKGNESSVSMKHVDYLRKQVENDYAIVPVARDIRKIESDGAYFDDVLGKIRDSEIVVWVFPIYLYMVPAQLKRFVEIVLMRGKEGCFKGKYATSLSTSSMIYDYPAHEYMHAVSEDLGMTYIPGYSFEAVTEKSLLDAKIRRSFIAHFKDVFLSVRNKAAYPVKYMGITRESFPYSPKAVNGEKKKTGKKLLIVSDHLPGSNLEKMVETFVAASACMAEVVNLNDMRISEGCAGCLQCQFEGKCVFDDDVREVFEGKMMESSGVVFAATIVDRHLSSGFKAFFDRSFFMAQTPKLRGKYAGFLVSGPLRQMELVSQYIDIYISARFMVKVGAVSDEYPDSERLTRIIGTFAGDMARHIDNGTTVTSPFFGRAYHLMLREMLSIISSAKTNAYNFYSRNKLFDFPHKNLKHVSRKTLYNVIFNLPVLKHRIRRKIVKLQLSSYEKLLAGE